MSSSFMGLIVGVTQQCYTCQPPIRKFQVVSHYLPPITYSHSVVQITELDHSIFIPLLASFEQSARSGDILLVFWNVEKGL